MKLCVRFVCGIAALLVANAAVCQISLEAIKNDPGYIYAEGEGVTFDEAHNNALVTLGRQVSTVVASRFEEYNSQMVKSGQITHSVTSQEGAISSYSTTILRNVPVREISPAPEAKAIVWMEVDELARLIDLRKQKAIDYFKAAIKAEKRLQIDDALRYYYWAMMIARSVPEPVYVDLDDETENCAMLESKIKSVLHNTRASLSDCKTVTNRSFAEVAFTYAGLPVASLELKYFNGDYWDGPLSVRDGRAELELMGLPANKKIEIRYEYVFRDQAIEQDPEVGAILQYSERPDIDMAKRDIAVEVDAKHNRIKPSKRDNRQFSPNMPDGMVAHDPLSVKIPEVITQPVVADANPYAASLSMVEEAIKTGNPRHAFDCFSPDGYKLFDRLLSSTGNVSLIGDKQNYTFVEANGQIIGKPCRVKIRYRSGKTYMENLTFRFNPLSHKIESLALMLTHKAEADIFNAAVNWPGVSRYTILQFMEDYQTAFMLKRSDYIESIFAEDAIIITGTVLKKASPEQVAGSPFVLGERIDLGNNKVLYNRLSKQQYIQKLKRHFKEREFVHLTFEDNKTKVIASPRIPFGSAFAIEISQRYDSPRYSDQGYLTLVLDTTKELPIIHVRLWQPDRADISIDQFINQFPM